MAFSWREAPDLMQRLNAAQNHPAHQGRDVMTFAGFCDSREELRRHVLSCEEQARVMPRPLVRRRSSGQGKPFILGATGGRS